MTRIFPIWLFSKKFKELNPFSHITQSIESFSRRWLKELNPSYKTHRLENFLLNDSKTSTFWTWLNELSLFSTWLKELNFFFGIWLNGLNPLHKRTQRIGHQKIIWLQQPNLFVYDLVNWAFVFLVDSKNWTFSQKYHSKIIDLFDMTHRIELRFRKWLTELNFFFLKNITHRNWTLLFNMSQRKWLHF